MDSNAQNKLNRLVNKIIFSRIWAMPNSKTFSIKPIKRLIERYSNPKYISIDPFSCGSRMAKITNDIDPSVEADYHLDALDFLRQFEDSSVDLVLYDPPYSPRQVSECYKKLNLTVNMQTTQSSYWAKQKEEIARVVKENGVVISCGWNSNGIGEKRGFELIEVLLVPHGGAHNDTIVIVEKKKCSNQ